MVIDVHYHVVTEEWLPENWWKTICGVYVHALKEMGMEMSPEDVKKNILDTFWDPDGDKLVAEMDASGIDKTVILPQDLSHTFGAPKVSIEMQNKAYADIQKKHPDRIIAFAGVDPRNPDALGLIEKAVKEWGLKGVKMHPGMGWYPDSPEAYPFMEKVNQLGVPVLTHAGMWVGMNKPCQPIYLDTPLITFPNMKIIAAHLGRGWERELCELAVYRPNLGTDFSGWQLAALHNYDGFCRALRTALDSFGAGRVFFGTDGPFLRPALPNKDFVQMIKSLPEKAPEGVSFTEAEVEAMLGGAAARWLGLS